MKVYEHSCLGDDVHICANKQRTLSHFCCAEVLLCDSICLCVWINACFFKLLSIHVKAEYIKSPIASPRGPTCWNCIPSKLSKAKLPFVHKDAARHCMKNISGFITLSDISGAHPHSYLFLFFFFFFNLPLFCLDAGWWNPEEESGWLGVV